MFNRALTTRSRVSGIGWLSGLFCWRGARQKMGLMSPMGLMGPMGRKTKHVTVVRPGVHIVHVVHVVHRLPAQKTKHGSYGIGQGVSKICSGAVQNGFVAAPSVPDGWDWNILSERDRYTGKIVGKSEICNLYLLLAHYPV